MVPKAIVSCSGMRNIKKNPVYLTLEPPEFRDGDCLGLGIVKFLLVALRAARAADAAVGLGTNRGVVPTVQSNQN